MECGTHNIFLTDARISSDGELIVCGQFSKNEDQINLLMEKIKMEVDGFPPIEGAKIGDICVAKFAEDGQWYRARITSRFNNLWMLEFIDYGNIQATNESNMRILPAHLNDLGPQAHTLVLNLEAAPKHCASLWTPAVTEVIQEEYMYAEIELQVTDVKSNANLAKCLALRDTLLKKGMIVEKQSHPFSSFPVGSKFKAYVSNCSGFGHLHIQADQSTQKLNKLMDDMAEHYGRNDVLSNMLLSPDSIKTGMLVCSVYSADGGFYRGQVRSVMGDMCTVFHIDYGDSEQKSLKSLYTLPEEFCALEYQAIDCDLFNVSFTENVTADFVSDIITDFVSDKLFEISVVEHKNLNCLAIEMSSAGATSLLQHLVERGCALPKKASMLNLKQLTFKTGEKVKMVLTSVEEDGSFYCYNVVNENALNEQLDALYEACTGPHAVPLKDVIPGMYCCALYHTDGNWYRAQLVRHSADRALVRFIDYGNTSTCPHTLLLQLQEKFLKLPIQSVHCLLSADLHGTELVDTLNEIKDEEVVVEFVNSESVPNAVRLYHDGTVVGITKTMREQEKRRSPCKIMTQKFEFKKRVVSLGSQKQILVRGIDDLKSIWGTLVETASDMQNLVEEVNDIYNAIMDADYKLQPEDCDPSHPCVVHDPKDRLWYRAKLLKQMDIDIFQVFYVDYGRRELVPGAAIKMISPHLLEIPEFALKFTLLGIRTDIGLIPSIQYDALLPSAKDKTFMGTFDSYDPERDLYFVELHDAAGHLRTHSRSQTSSLSGGNALPSLELPINIEIPVRLTCVEDPDCIWVQLLDNQADLIVLTGKMNAFYNSVPDQSLMLSNSDYGQICCLKSAKNKNWCRGIVIYSYGETIEVKFLDFGYEEAAHRSEAKVLLPEFSTLPGQAVRCCLHNLRPSSSHWTNGSARFLQEFVAKSGLSAEFAERKASGAYSIKMYVSSNDDKLSIGKQMVDDGHAAWIDIDVASASIAELRSSVKGPANNEIPESLSPACISKSQGMRLFYHHPGIALIGAEVPAVVCDSPTPSDFFILPRNSEVKNTHNELFKELKKCYNGDSPSIDNMYIGMPCIWFDGSDCLRAAIVVEDPANPTIFLVDFGEKKSVCVSSLKQIMPKHITCLPPIAIRCTLHGVVEPQNQYWSSDAMVLFTKFAKESKKDLVCSIHGCVSDGVSQFFMVRLVTPFKDIVTELVSKGNCIKTMPLGKMKPPFQLRSFVYSSLGVGIGKEDQFYVTHIERPDLFYCQMASRFCDIDGVMDKLQAYCVENPVTKSVTCKDLAFSPPCLAKYEDDRWYRAHYVASCSDIPNSAVVMFVDFGNTVSVPLANIMSCDYKSGLADLPIQALPCCLSEITSPVTDASKLDLVMLTMEDKILLHQLPGTITGSTNGRFHLDLLKDGKRVNEEIVNVLLGDESAQIEERYVSNIRDCDPRLREKYKEIKNIEPKSVHSAYVSQVTSPHDFHIRLESFESQFKTCTADVDGFYTAVRQQDYHVSVLENGNVVCAKHPSTMRWCRAVVIDADSYRPNQVLVEFVDTGETECISIEDNAKKIVSDMMIWPRMALKCHLANVVPNGGAWSEACLDFFSRTCQYINCRIRFTTFDVTQGTWNIDMKIDGKNVAHMLVEQKFANFIKPPSSTGGSSMCIKTKKCEPWPVGMENEVYISHVETGSILYLQLVKSEAALNSLMDKLNDTQLSLEKPKQQDVRLNCSYAAKYEEDGQWYRANITAIKPSSYSVLYSDYGNSAEVMLEELRLLPRDCTALPEQAIKCRVFHSSTVDKKVVMKKLEELAMAEGPVQAKVVKRDAISSEMVVNLFVTGSDGMKVDFVELLPKTNANIQSHTSADNPVKLFKKIDIPHDVQTKAYVSQVDGPDRIWIQLSSHSSELDKMMSSIDSYYRTERSDLSLPELKSGTPCIAKYSVDDGWYRASILNVDTVEQSATVLFVDYGNSEKIQLTSIKAIDEQFLKLPVQAIACRLKDIPAVEDWMSEDTDKLVEQVGNIEMTARFEKPVYPVNKEEDLMSSLYTVELSFTDGSSLNDEWIELLRHRKSVIPKVVLDGRGDTNTTSPQLKTTEKHIVNDRGDHIIVENLQIENANLDFNASAMDDSAQDNNAHVRIDSLLVEKGTLEEGYISHAENPSHFYIQLARFAHDLDKIYEEVTKDTGRSLNEEIEVGQYYVAKSPDDGEWYRAKCTDILDNESVQILFFDYGNTSTVNVGHIRPLSDAAEKYPKQALLCKLYDSEPVGESWSESIDYFLDLTLDKDLKIEFIEKNTMGYWNVKLLIDGKNVAQNLVENKYAKIPVTKSEVAPEVHPTALEQGSMLCAKVVHMATLDDLTLLLMNMNVKHVQDSVNEYVKSIGTNLNEQSLSSDDLMPGIFCLTAGETASIWNCVLITAVDEKNCTISEIGSDKTTELQKDNNTFLKLPSSVSGIINQLCIQCSLSGANDIREKFDKFKNFATGKMCIGTFLEKDETSGKWTVDLSLVGERVRHVFDAAPESELSSLGIKNTCEKNETENSSHSGSSVVTHIHTWMKNNVDCLIKSLDEVLSIRESCPPFLTSHFQNIISFKKAIESNLSKTENASDEYNLHSPSELLKRPIETSSSQNNAFNKLTPCKKMKLDENENLPLTDENFVPEEQQEAQTAEDGFNVGDEFEAVISKIDSPYSFYVRPFLVLSEPEALNLKSTHVEETEKYQRKNIKEGSFCLAKYSEPSSQVSHWVRAMVLDRENEKYFLQDLDTNLEFSTSSEDIFHIVDADSWPSLCLQCSLSGVRPKYSSDNIWPKEINKEFRDLVLNSSLEDCVNVKILSYKKLCNSKTLVFYVDISVNGCSVTDTLVDMDLAQRIDPMEEIEKENMHQDAEIVKPVITHTNRKPLADLGVPNISVMDEVTCSPVESSDLPDFDLLAVPWRIVRTSIRSSRSENLSDSVFVSDIDDSLILPSAKLGPLPAFSQKPLTPFKIYCSTATPVEKEIRKEEQIVDSSGVTLDEDAYDTIPTSSNRLLIHSNQKSTYVAASPLEPPTSSYSDNSQIVALTDQVLEESQQEECSVERVRNIEDSQSEENEEGQEIVEKEEILSEVTKKLLADVYLSIELDEEDESGCTIPDSLVEIQMTKNEVSGTIEVSNICGSEGDFVQQENALIYELAKLDISDPGEEENYENISQTVEDLFQISEFQEETDKEDVLSAKSSHNNLDNFQKSIENMTQDVEGSIHDDDNATSLSEEKSMVDIPLPPDLDLKESPFADICSMMTGPKDSQQFHQHETDLPQEEEYSEEVQSLEISDSKSGEDVDEGENESKSGSDQDEQFYEDFLEDAEELVESGSNVIVSVSCEPKISDQPTQDVEPDDALQEDEEDFFTPRGSFIVPEIVITQSSTTNVSSTKGSQQNNNEQQNEKMELKERVESCISGHEHSKYICCVPKMQLEVGDLYLVTYLNSENPQAIHLQFDIGQDSEEWRAAMCKVNEDKGVDDLNGKESWEPDMLCLVQCVMDMSWDRGRIVGTVDGDKSLMQPQYFVELIDYGDVVPKSRDKLLDIPDTLCMYPPQTVLCELGNISPVQQDDSDTVPVWNSETNQYLKDLLSCSTLTAEVTEICESSDESRCVVRLYLPDNAGKEQDVAGMLINAELAKAVSAEEEMERKKREAEEWSTMTDSAWETLLNPAVSSSDLMHSSNIDLSNLTEVEISGEWPVKPEEGEKFSSIKDAPQELLDKNEAEVRSIEEDIEDLGEKLQSQIMENALVLSGIQQGENTEDFVEETNPRVVESKHTSEIYLDLEALPSIAVEYCDSTQSTD